MKLENAIVVNKDKTLSDINKERILYVIDKQEDLQKYCNAYLKEFSKSNIKYKLNRPKVIIDSCLVKNSLNNLNFYILQNCQTKIPMNHSTESVLEVLNCHIIDGIRLSASSNLFISNSIFELSLSFGNVGNINIEFSIIGSLGLSTSSSPEISNSYIKRVNFTGHYSTDFKLTANTIIEESVFSSTTFSSAAIFTDIKFKTSPKIHGELSFASCNVEFKNITFEDLSSSEALGVFRSIKKACENAHYEHGVILFHGFELETNYNLHLKDKWFSSDFPEAFSSWLHKKFTDYGRNLMTPVWALFLFFLVGINAYVFSDYPKNLIVDMSFFGNSLLVSLKSTLGPLALGLSESTKEHINCMVDKMPWSYKIWSFIHTIISSLLWFMIIFMTRRRFKI